MFAEGLEDMLGHSPGLFPLHSILDEVLPGKFATSFLEASMSVGDIWGRKAAKVGRFGEGDGVDRVLGHYERYLGGLYIGYK